MSGLIRVALIPVALTMLAGCGTTTDTSAFGGRVVRRAPDAATSPATPTTTAEPQPTFISYGPTSCPFDLASANGLSVECSSLVVPMRRAKSDGHTITLAVARIHSTSPTPQPDPVVYLDGGPGGSALSGIDFWTKPVAPFLADRDLILIDQRGTGYSVPRLSCDSLNDTLSSSVAVEYTEQCVHVLQNQGVDLSAFNTTENAADVADLRKAMKIPQWNLFGISYGTRLALWTMKTHPEGIRSVVIDSVYPPAAELPSTTEANFVRSVQAIATDCAAQPACDRAFPDVMGQLTSGIDKLNQRYPGEGDDFATSLFQVLYSTAIAPDIPKIIAAVNRGDLRTADDLMSGSGARARNPDSDKNRPPPGAYRRPAMSEGLFHSVQCAEDGQMSSAAKVRANAAGLPPSLAKGMVDIDLREVAICSVWAVTPAALSEVHSDIPTLVMSGTYDPITPPAFGELAAKNLARSQFQLVQGSGHGTWLAGDCPQQKITQFFADPITPGPDCTGAPPDFAL